MKNILIVLTMLLAMGVSSVYADEATLNALMDAGVELTPEQAKEILVAQGDELVALIEELAGAANSVEAVVIINAAIKAARGNDAAKFASLRGEPVGSGNSNASPHN